MEKGREGDAIALYALRQIDCVIPAHIQSIGQLTPEIIITVVNKCLNLVSGGKLQFEVPLPKNIATKHRICTEMASKIKSYGYLGDCGYNQLLYPVESQTRSLIIFLIQKLPQQISSAEKSKKGNNNNDDDDEEENYSHDDFNNNVKNTTRKQTMSRKLNSRTLHNVLSKWKSMPWKLPFTATSSIIPSLLITITANTLNSPRTILSPRKQKEKQQNDNIIQSIQNNNIDNSYQIFYETLSQQSKNIYFHRSFQTLLNYESLSILEIFKQCKRGDGNTSCIDRMHVIEHTLFERNSLIRLKEGRLITPDITTHIDMSNSKSTMNFDGSTSISSSNYADISNSTNHSNNSSQSNLYISPSDLYTKSFNAMIQSLAVTSGISNSNNNSTSNSRSRFSQAMSKSQESTSGYISIIHNSSNSTSINVSGSSRSLSPNEIIVVELDTHDDSSSTSDLLNELTLNEEQRQQEEEANNKLKLKQQEQQQQLSILQSNIDQLQSQIVTQQTELHLLTFNLLTYEQEYKQKLHQIKSLNTKNLSLFSTIDEIEKNILLKKELLMKLPTAQASIYQLQLDCNHQSIVLLKLTQQFELLRVPIITEIRQITYEKQQKELQYKSKIDTISQLKQEIKLLSDDVSSKEILVVKQQQELNKMNSYNNNNDGNSINSGEMNRNTYTDRILEITHSIAKQNKEIDRIVSDIHRVQKAISHTTLVLQRADTVAEELIYGATNAAASSSSTSSTWSSSLSFNTSTTITPDKSTLISIYKQLITLRHQFDALFHSMDKFAQNDKIARDMETKIDQDRQRISDSTGSSSSVNSTSSSSSTVVVTHCNLNKFRFQNDLRKIQLENQELSHQLHLLESSNGSTSSTNGINA